MIPDFQSIMLPLLQLLSDKQIHKGSEVKKQISDKFQLTEDERKELLASGTQFKIDNRVYWAISYLKNANLLHYPIKGHYQITENGLQILTSNPEKINTKFLKTIPEFKQWQDASKTNKQTSSNNIEQTSDVSEITPDELLDSSYSKLLEVLSVELIEKIKSCTPKFFEILVVDLLIKMGYGGSRVEAGKVLGKSHDGGIDGLIKEDKLGLDTI